MTRRTGTLWKTSWNRRRGTPIPDPVDMPYFILFDNGDGNIAQYRSPVDSLLGETLPFWFGVVGLGLGGGFRAGGASSSGWAGTVFGSPGSPDSTIGGASSVAPGTGESLSMTVPGTVGYAEAVLVVVEEDGSGFRVRTYFNAQEYIVVYSTDPYTPPAPGVPLILDPGEAGALHGGCGGDGLLTTAEMSEWFAALKRNASMPSIPGKTTHFYSAADVFPSVPNPLPSAGTEAQDLELLVIEGQPAPQNIMLPTRFNW